MKDKIPRPLKKLYFLKKRSKHGPWMIHYRTGYRCHDWARVSTRTANKSDAMQLMSDMNLPELVHAKLAGAIQGRVMARLACGNKTMTLLGAAREWGDVQIRRGGRNSYNNNRMNLIIRCLEYSKVAENKLITLRPEVFASYLNRPGPKLSTRKWEQGVLHQWCEWLRDGGFSDAHYMATVAIDISRLQHEQKESRAKLRFTEDEILTLLNHLRPARGFWYYAVLLSSKYGFRMADMARLECASVRQDFVLYTSKTNRREERAVEHGIMEELRAIKGQATSRYLWPDVQGKYSYLGTGGILSTEFAAVLKKAGLGGRGLSFHCLRRSVATRTWEAHHDIKRVQQELGHANPWTSQLYIVGQPSSPGASASGSASPPPVGGLAGRTPHLETAGSSMSAVEPHGTPPSAVHAG